MRHYVISSVFVILAGSAAADIPLVMHDLNDYGFVWDLNLGHGSPDDPIWGEDRCGLNDMSCVPTSWTNCLVYLQNKYESDLAGLEIAGAGNDYYNAWSETVATLRSPEFMNTTAEDPGTTPYGQVNGIEQFLIHQGAGPLATSYQAIAANFMLEEFASAIPLGEAYPEWLMRGAPDLHQLNQWLIEDAAVVIDVLWEAEGEPDNRGHALALVGMEWTDSNDNKWVDPGEGTLYVIDPLDPTVGNYTPDGFSPVGPAKWTAMDVWQQESTETPLTFGMLKVQYQQSSSKKCEAYTEGTGTAEGWLGGAGALNIIGGPGGSCCLVTGCDALTQAQCTDLGGSWTLQGSCDDCPEYCEGDTNHDGYVNMDDLLNMLGGWGPCP